MMITRSLGYSLLVLQLAPTTVSSERQINASASASNTIHVEEDVDLTYVWGSGTGVKVDSNIPVQYGRYTDYGYFLDGQQPINGNLAKVLVTSDCDTSETQVVPSVSVTDTGTITVRVDVPEAEANAMKFLEPSSYKAIWSWLNDFCGFNPWGSTPVPIEPPTDECPEGQCLDPTGACAKQTYCFADPCEVSNDCVEGETCTSNYCGGCNTECVPAVESMVGASCGVFGPSCGDELFCQFEMGMCNDSFARIIPPPDSGVCARKPDTCITMYDPVCGCDDNTYSNECVAWSNGVSAKYKGECLPPGSPNVCDSDDTCSEGEFCELEGGDCNAPFGVCVTKPDACMMMYAPVCGCDSNTYSNSCVAQTNGITVARKGECGPVFIDNPGTAGAACGVGSAETCGTGDFCQLDTGVCNGLPETQKGTCEELPEACPDIYMPVCGCDGNTYSSDCDAHSNGISVASEGECGIALTQDPTALTTVAAKPQCKQGTPCSEQGAVCSSGSETCCGQTYDSFQCTCEDTGSGVLQYSFCLYTDACMYPSCCMSGPPADKAPPAEGTCKIMGQLCQTGIKDDYCCYNMDGPGQYCTVSGGKEIESTTPATAESILPDQIVTSSSTMATEESTTSAATTVASTTGSTSSTTSTTVASTIEASSSTTAATTEESTTSAATTVSSTAGSTTVVTTTTSTTAKDITIGGDFPTESPGGAGSNGPTQTPTTWWEKRDTDGADFPNSAFNRPQSLTLCVATTFVILAIFFPVNGNNPRGFGAFAVAAMAATSIYSKKTPAAKSGNVRTNALQTERSLQTCTFNVEILVDGCTHAIEINGPSARYIDAAVENIVSQQSPEDECVTEYEADINFPAANAQQVDKTVPAFEQWGPECARAVLGRPFVDATGGSIQALPYVPGSEDAALSWSGETSFEASSFSNITTHFFLGEDWQQRALGEHASVASFSAFSIALMTNQAPSELVTAALEAGLDEVRHAKTSFEIASKLIGREVQPGKLPESKLEFYHDLEALALAVAREGCVDETLSAFVAAVEVGHLLEVLDRGVTNSPYSGLDRDLVEHIKDELVTIAMDESNHSALAWRTINWVCSVDKVACSTVHKEVFEASYLEGRLNQRANDSLGERSLVLDLFSQEWKKIFNAHVQSGQTVCEEARDSQVVDDHHSDKALLASVTENVLRQVAVCN